MSIASIHGATRVPSSTADRAAGAAGARDAATAPATSDVAAGNHDTDAFKAPSPPRFPWLSRLTLQLESASKQKPPFEPAPLLGDHVDKSA